MAVVSVLEQLEIEEQVLALLYQVCHLLGWCALFGALLYPRFLRGLPAGISRLHGISSRAFVLFGLRGSFLHREHVAVPVRLRRLRENKVRIILEIYEQVLDHG